MAVLWDMDGTLIDSEPYWIEAETALVERFGGTWSEEDGLTLVGRPLPYSARILQGRGVALPEDEIVATLTASVAERIRGAVPWQEDARALLQEVVAAGVPCALVTMSYRRMADALLAAVPEAFQVVVTGDEVRHGKPDPESYLLAAHRLGVDIARCVAIEDSPSGIGAAWSSGAATIAVRRLAKLDARPGLTRLTTLDGLGLEGIRAIANGEVRDELTGGA